MKSDEVPASLKLDSAYFKHIRKIHKYIKVMDQNKKNWPKFSEYLEPLSIVVKDLYEDDTSSTGILSSMNSQISNFDLGKNNSQ